MFEVSFPTPRRPYVLMQLGSETISFDSYDESQLPLNGAQLCDTLRALGTDNLIYLMMLALLEQKILVHSLRYFDLYEDPPPDVTCFDLDTATISQSLNRQTLKLSILPKKPTKQLKATLDDLFRRLNKEAFDLGSKKADYVPVDREMVIQKKRKELEMAIHDAFLSHSGRPDRGALIQLRDLSVNSSTSGFPRRLDPALFQLDQLNLNRSAEHTVPVQYEHNRCAAVRTKPEMKSSILAATNSVRTNPLHWPKTLLFYAYSLWFMQLPSLISIAPNKRKILFLAFHVLDRMEHTEVFPLDQVCYRILIELCGECGEPSLAVKVLQAMHRAGVEQNAVTYGIYHRACVER
ncbi:PPR repeat protein [Ostertagia ostertagi]